MTVSTLPAGYEATDLTRTFAKAHIRELLALANTIPLITHTEQDILGEIKAGRQLHAKWQHGLAVIKDGVVVSFVAAYERAAEGNDQYPVNTLYISELVVAQAHQYQGIATTLMGLFIEKNNAFGFQVLTGDLNYSLQTNSAAWNLPVINLYKTLGFQQRALKQYPDRTDIVLGRTAT